MNLRSLGARNSLPESNRKEQEQFLADPPVAAWRPPSWMPPEAEHDPESWVTRPCGTPHDPPGQNSFNLGNWSFEFASPSQIIFNSEVLFRSWLPLHNFLSGLRKEQRFPTSVTSTTLAWWVRQRPGFARGHSGPSPRQAGCLPSAPRL